MNTAIPGLNESFLVPNTELIDTVDEDVAYFISEMISGNIVCDSRAIDIIGLKNAIHVTK